MQPGEIGDSVPLFGEGLGLDSIDVLELVLESSDRSASRSKTMTRRESLTIGGHDRGVHRSQPENPLLIDD